MSIKIKTVPKLRATVLMHLILLAAILCSSASGQPSISVDPKSRMAEFGNGKLYFKLDYNLKCVVTDMKVNGEPVLASQSGIFSSLRTADAFYSTRQLATSPTI
jgi:hypothetical protein